MARNARWFIEGLPYHITQRGNRQQDVFFSDADRRRYLSWLMDYGDRLKLDVLAYCLMTNHIHLIAVPHDKESVSRVLQALQTRHSNTVNSEQGWAGHLWHGRFFSAVLDDAHLWLAARYVERNPVRAGIVKTAEEYAWSSAAFHLGLRPDRLIRSDTQWGAAVEGWAEALHADEEEAELDMLRCRTQRGYPCGSESFVAEIEAMQGCKFSLRSRGRPPKVRNGVRHNYGWP
jgi:putative transposase